MTRSRCLYLILFFGLLSVQCATAQPSIFYDFQGEHVTTNGMVSTEDSLYVFVSNSVCCEKLGQLFRLDKQGKGFHLIKAFSGEIASSLVGNDSILYGSTKAVPGGKIFKYEIRTGTFTILKELTSDEAQEVKIVHATDSVLWGISQITDRDEGSIFTINLDGSNFKKIYNQTNIDLGRIPWDIEIVGDQIFVAFYDGGNMYLDGFGGGGGKVVRMNTDGSGYSHIFDGEKEIGIHPISLLKLDDKIYCLFESRGGSGSFAFGSLARFDLDGSNFEIVSNLDGVGRGDLMESNGVLFGITTRDFFEFDPTLNQLSTRFTFAQFDIFDGICGPVLFDNSFVLATQQEGLHEEAQYIGNIVKYVFENLENQTITFNALPAKTYGDAAFDLSASSTSGLEISYASSVPGVATISGNKVTIVGAGSTVITASQKGTHLFKPGESIQQTLVVNKATITATADDYTRVYGIANPTLTISYTGFVNGETIAVIDTPPSATTAATPESPPALYDIVPSGGVDNNYSFIYVNGELTITPTFSLNGSITKSTGGVLKLGLANLFYEDGGLAASSDVINGNFLISSLTDGRYILQIVPLGDESSEVFPTYYEAALLHGNATVLIIEGDQSITMEMPAKTKGSGGNAQVRGHIEARESGGRTGATKHSGVPNLPVYLLKGNTEDIEAVAITDSEGNFTMKDVPIGVYRLALDFVGKSIDETSDEVIINESTRELEVMAVITSTDAIQVSVTIAVVTGIEKIENVKSLYPNPAIQSVSIAVTPGQTKMLQQVKIYSIDGKIYDVPTTNLDDKIFLDVSLIPSGLYVIQLQFKEGKEVRKFVKE